MAKKSRNFYLSAESLQILAILAERLNVSQAAIMEMALKEFAIRQAQSDVGVIQKFLVKSFPELQEYLAKSGQDVPEGKAKEE